MSNKKTVTMTEKDLISSAAAATGNLIKEIQANEGYEKAARDVVSHEIAEISMQLTAYLVELLFGPETKEEEEPEND